MELIIRHFLEVNEVRDKEPFSEEVVDVDSLQDDLREKIKNNTEGELNMIHPVRVSGK